MMSSPTVFNAASVLCYLSLPADYTPSPSDAPIKFLTIHLHQLPPNLLTLFSSVLNPHQRTVLPTIRNRRQKYASTNPRELTWPEARKLWPELWEGRERPGLEQGREEKQWADRGLEFLGGQKGQVGKLGQLLGDYEEEREAERMRQARQAERMRQARQHNIAQRDITRQQQQEEGEDEDEEDEEYVVEEQESPDQVRVNFERMVQEKFIYGLLDSIDYDSVDWDDKWDETEERDCEERWFDEEEEAEAPIMDVDT